MKILDIKTRFIWKVIKSEKYVGVCNKLGLSLQADSLPELIDEIEGSTSVLFQDVYDSKELSKYTFDHSIEFKLKDQEFPEVYLEMPVSPILVEE